MDEGPHAVAVEASGRFIYVANVDSQSIAAYAIEPVTDTLQPLPGFPLPLGERLDAMAMDPPGVSFSSLLPIPRESQPTT